MTPTDRTDYTRNLRRLADLLDANPAMPIPYQIDRGQEVGWYIQGTIGDALAIRDVMGDPKVVRSDSSNFPVDIIGTVAGMRARVQIVAKLALADGETVTLPVMVPALAELVSS